MIYKRKVFLEVEISINDADYQREMEIATQDMVMALMKTVQEEEGSVCSEIFVRSDVWMSPMD